MSVSLASRTFYVNTLYRTSGTSENFSYTLPIPHNLGYNRIVVLQAIVPATFYLIQDGVNTFQVLENGTLRPITIPPGNYDAITFATAVTAAMNGGCIYNWLYTVQMINPVDGVYTYTVTTPDVNGFTLTGVPSIICTDQVNEQLGFAPNSTNSFGAQVAGQVPNNAGLPPVLVAGFITTLTSTQVVDLAPESSLYIHSNISNSGDSDVLQEIYTANSVTMGFITYQCTAPDLYSKQLVDSQSNTFQFSITNKKQQLMQLRGADIQLTLCLYRKDDTPELLNKYFKMMLSQQAN
jgi:hypothetical protein